MQGRRREDTIFGDLPEDMQPGDYWKYLASDGEHPIQIVSEPSNLTGSAWGFYAPNGCGIGTLMKHTVREHEDGTITVAPNDGSSNSILITGGNNCSWHGYVDHGIWSEV